MLKECTGALGQFLTSAFKSREVDEGLVRLFRVEYQTDYKNAKKLGAVINEQYVKTFLEDRRQL